MCYLGCQLPFKQLGGFFGISERCVIKVVDYIMKLLCEKSKMVIKWPDKEEYPAIADAFNSKRMW